MSKLAQLKGVQMEVYNLLEKAERYRDSDPLLVAAYYYEKKGKELYTMSAVDFLQLLVNGSLPFPDNITRVRRKIQQNYPHLRGKFYKDHQEIESEVRNGIHEL